MKLLFLIFGLLILQTVFSTSGLDISQADCGSISLSEWKCFAQNGKSFAIVEAFDGGYGIGSHVKDCVANAWSAGFAHVDVYAFMCPNCAGNNPPSSAVEKLVGYLSANRVNYGMLWFDIEQCSGCWNDASSNVAFIKEAVEKAQQLGVNVGIYSSEGEWSATVGSSSAFSNLPLWYAHYDGEPNFNDQWAYSFGGWSSPAMKQYYDSSSVCYSNVDVDWYP
ncbi:gh family 25 lysozyme 3-related [Anaeramoeba ignava]|uniref:Gh family 25 lysozyme 3-related n=1 Tax=Anaeramoeba ignava TaxID=1746090 RepID=A0A9Q0R8E4_ANAIG|nr:gh family 25 lysozyme 3-related [Anaeramoeba ignava]|eukprot:Anaeramoba_ignava/a101204_308.p1 GENE.a101204_308~~a101204_308.p1  ORF type:complete len:222 (-),score=69.02 a101204_308:71-736(-)